MRMDSLGKNFEKIKTIKFSKRALYRHLAGTPDTVVCVSAVTTYFRMACWIGKEIDVSGIIAADDQLLGVGGTTRIDVGPISTFWPDSERGETQRASIAAPLQIAQMRRLGHLPTDFRVPLKSKCCSEIKVISKQRESLQ